MIIVVLIMVAAITAVLIAGEISAPKNKIIAALRIWQTYLAALVGLTAVIISIAVPQEIAAAKERDAMRKLENAYLVDLRTRLDSFKRDVRTHLDLLEAIIEGGNVRIDDCNNALRTFERWQAYASINAPDNFALTNLSTQTYFQLSRFSGFQNTYAKRLNAFTTTDCTNNPTAVVGDLVNLNRLYESTADTFR